MTVPHESEKITIESKENYNDVDIPPEFVYIYRRIPSQNKDGRAQVPSAREIYE